MLKVAHVIPSFYPAVQYGGAIESTRHLCAWLTHEGADVRVLTTDANGRRGRLTKLSGRHVTLDGASVRYCRRLMGQSVAPGLLVRLISHVQWADVVHLTSAYSFPTIPTLLLCRALKIPVVWSPRGAFQRWNGTRRIALKNTWDAICQTVRPSRLIMHVTSDAEGVETKARLNEIEIRKVPNGVDIPLNICHVPKEETLRLLFLGRLDPKKGLENLLEAIRIVEDRRGPQLRLTIAGTGESFYSARLLHRIHELGVGHRVDMVGWAAEATKRSLFAATDVLIMPSETENFGMVVAEALAHGVPVIVSHATPWEDVERIGCGLSVSSSPADLASALIRTANLPLKEMGLRGREWMRRDFSWPTVTRSMCDIYEDLLGVTK